jgi:hypothetical protein
MTDFESQVLSDLATLKTQMQALLGNGQPGRLRQLEQRVERHEALVQRAGGIGALFGFLITALHFAFDYLRLRR